MEQNKRETGGSGAAPGRSGGYGGVGAASIDGVAALLAAAAASDGVDALVAAAGTEGLSLDVSSGDAPQVKFWFQNKHTQLKVLLVLLFNTI